MLESPLRLVLGLLTGVVFGVLLQKGRVAKHGVIVGQLVLRDFTVAKIMLTAVAVGAVGYWSLLALGWTAAEVKSAPMGGVLVGALLFGSGLAVLGYCPGTTVAAVGEGRRDALAGLFGMAGGALAFVRAWPVVNGGAAGWGRLSLSEATHVAPATYVGALAAVALATYLASRASRARHAR